MDRDVITETPVSPDLVGRAVEAVLRLDAEEAATVRGRAAAILDMLIDAGVVEGIVETGIAIQARLDAYVELMSCPAMFELHPSRARLSDACILNAISRAPLRLFDGRYRFCLRELLALLPGPDSGESPEISVRIEFFDRLVN